MISEKRIVVAGASGLIGNALVSHLEARGHEVKRLVRRNPETVNEYEWDPYEGIIDSRALKGTDAVVGLSGAGIGDRRWTDSRKKVLYESRIATTRFLAESIADADEPAPVFVSQSAIGIYGDRGDEIMTEDSEPGSEDDFLVQLTEDWEEATVSAERAGVRVVTSRTGLVIDRRAQLVERLLPLFRAGVGGPLGDGRQWWSWISLRDNVRAIEHLIESEISGPVNLVSPNPVRQREFSRALAAAVGRPAMIPAPRLGLKLALGAEKAKAIGLSSTRALPSVLNGSGFAFLDDDLEVALREMVASPSDS